MEAMEEDGGGSLPLFQDKNRLYHDPQTGCQSIGSWSWGRDKGKSYLEKGVPSKVTNPPATHSLVIRDLVHPQECFNY